MCAPTAASLLTEAFIGPRRGKWESVLSKTLNCSGGFAGVICVYLLRRRDEPKHTARLDRMLLSGGLRRVVVMAVAVVDSWCGRGE